MSYLFVKYSRSNFLTSCNTIERTIQKISSNEDVSIEDFHGDMQSNLNEIQEMQECKQSKPKLIRWKYYSMLINLDSLS